MSLYATGINHGGEKMTFELFCMALIGLAFGAAMIFGGYRLFLVLLPIWGSSLAS